MEKDKIQLNPAHKGLLHTKLSIPQGEKIPAKILAKAAKAPGKLGQEARFAENAKEWKRK